MSKPRSVTRLAGLAILAGGLVSLVMLFVGHMVASGQPTCTADWIGSSNGSTGSNWTTEANWSPATVPSATSVVCMGDNPSTTTINIGSSDNTSAEANAGAIELASGTLTDWGTLSIHDSGAADNSSINSLDVEGQLNLLSGVTASVGTFTLDGNETGVVDNEGTGSALTVTGNATLLGNTNVEGGTYIADGNSTIGTTEASGNVYLEDSAVFEAGTGTVTLDTGSTVSAGDGSSTSVDITTSGTLGFNATNSGDEASIDVPITMDGHGTASRGELDLEDGGTIGAATVTTSNGGSFVIDSNGFIEPSGQTGTIGGMTVYYTLSGPGSYAIPLGQTATLDGGEFSGATVTVDTGGFLDIDANSTGNFDNSAQVDIDGTLVFGANANLDGDNSTGLSLNIEPGGTMSYPDTTASDEAQLDVPMSDNGTTNVAHATLDIEADSTVGPDQATIGSGTFLLSGATLSPTGGTKTSVGSMAGIITGDDSALGGPGILEEPKGDTLSWPSTSMTADLHFENFGTISIPSGDGAGSESGSEFENEPGGVLKLADGTSFDGDNSKGDDIVNDAATATEPAGMIEYSGSNDTQINDMPLYNNGELTAEGGGDFEIENLVPSTTATAVPNGSSTIQPDVTTPPAPVAGKAQTGVINGLDFTDDSDINGPGTLEVTTTGTATFAAPTLTKVTIVNDGNLVVPENGGFELNQDSVIDNYGIFSDQDGGGESGQDSSADEIVNEIGATVSFKGSDSDDSADWNIGIDNLGTIDDEEGTFEIYLTGATLTPNASGTEATLESGKYIAGLGSIPATLEITNIALIKNGQTSTPSSPNLATNAANITLNSAGVIETDEATMAQGMATNAATGTITSDTTIAFSNKIVNDGTITQTAKTMSAPAWTLGGKSVTNISAGAILKGNVTLAVPTSGEAAAQLEGNGEVEGNIVNGAGTVSPTAGNAGALTVTGTYSQVPATGGKPSLAIGIESSGSTVGTDFSQLSVTGNATVGGALAITTGPKFTATTGSFVIMKAKSIAGSFATVTGQELGKTGKYFEVVYGPTSITLTISGPTVGTATPSALGVGASKVKVTLNGIGFAKGDVVSSANKDVTFSTFTDVSFGQATVLVSVSTAAKAGKTSIVVKPTSGASFSCASCLTIDAAPKVTKISPATLALGAKATPVTITGSGFNSPSTHPLTATITGASTTITAKVSGTVTATSFKLDITVPSTAKVGKYTIKILNGDYGVGSCSNCLTIAKKASPKQGNKSSDTLARSATPLRSSTSQVARLASLRAGLTASYRSAAARREV
jgi:hypothetical protein